MRLDKLLSELDKLKPYPSQVRLGVGLVTNVERMIQTHAGYLKAQSGNRIFKPYYDRLYELYQILNDDKSNSNQRND